jgi:O-antigen ligase
VNERKTIACKRIFLIGLLLSVAALPFSVKVCHAGLILLLGGWLFEGDWTRKINIAKSSLVLNLILVLLLIQLAGLTYSEHVGNGWFTMEKKIFFLLIPIAIATTSVNLNERELKFIFYSFVLSCFIGSLICVVHSWNEAGLIKAGASAINPYLETSSYHDLHPFKSDNWLVFSYVSLSDGINLHPTYFSLYLGFCIVFLLRQFPETRSPKVQIPIIILTIYFGVFIIFLASRIIILGLLIVFVFIIIRNLIEKRRAISAGVIMVTLLFSFLLFINPVSRYRSLQEVHLSTFRIEDDTMYTTASQIRVSLWWLAIQSLEKKDVIWGKGTGDVESAVEKTSDEYRITNILGSFDPHNQYLYTLLANGVVGLMTLIVFLATPAYFSWLRKDYLSLGFSFLFGLVCLTETALELQKGIAFYALFFPLLVFQYNSYQTTSFNFRSLLRAGN